MTVIGRQGKILPEDNIFSQEELDELIASGKVTGPFSQDEVRAMLLENSPESLEDVRENVQSGVPLSQEQLEMLKLKNDLPDELRQELPGVFRDRYEEGIKGELALYATGIRRANVLATDNARLREKTYIPETSDSMGAFGR